MGIISQKLLEGSSRGQGGLSLGQTKEGARCFPESPLPPADGNRPSPAGSQPQPRAGGAGPCTRIKAAQHRRVLSCRGPADQQAFFVMKGVLSPQYKLPVPSQGTGQSRRPPHAPSIELRARWAIWEFSRDCGPGGAWGVAPFTMPFSSHLENGVNKDSSTEPPQGSNGTASTAPASHQAEPVPFGHRLHSVLPPHSIPHAARNQGGIWGEQGLGIFSSLLDPIFCFHHILSLMYALVMWPYLPETQGTDPFALTSRFQIATRLGGRQS